MKALHRYANRLVDLRYKGMRRSVLIILICLVANHSFAQASKEMLQVSSFSNFDYDVKPLTVGDKVPDIFFHNVLNYKSKTARLSDFKGKLVILDMWSVTCTSCIAGFPKMEELQKEFGDKIQILLVNPHDAKYDSEEKIISILDRFKARTGFYTSLPLLIQDSVLNRYFPHESLPHYVWINGDRNVMAITETRDVTAKNIVKFLNGEIPAVSFKNDSAFDRQKPLYVDGNGGTEQSFLYRSMFTGFNRTVGSTEGGRFNNKGEILGLYILNKSLIELVREAYLELYSRLDKSREILDVKLPARFSEEYDPNNIYCYDVTIPASTIHEFNYRQFLKDDLKRVFGITARIEKRRIKCLSVKTVSAISRYFSNNDGAAIDLGRKNIKKFIKNVSIGYAIRLLQSNFGMPLIDETEMTDQRISVNFPDYLDVSNTNALINFLTKVGLQFESTERELEVVVISDR